MEWIGAAGVGAWRLAAWMLMLTTSMLFDVFVLLVDGRRAPRGRFALWRYPISPVRYPLRHSPAQI